MLTIHSILNSVNKKIIKTEREHLHCEKKSKNIIYSQKRIPADIILETSNLLLIKKRLLSLKKLQQSLSIIKKEDENSESTQKLLKDINIILQSI